MSCINTFDFRLCDHAALRDQTVNHDARKIPMEIIMRQWNRADLPQIQRAWLDFCRTASRPDMQLKPHPEREMTEWLMSRYRHPSSFGLIADRDAVMTGFLIGRVDEWESVPPI